MTEIELNLPDEAATMALGKAMAHHLVRGQIVWLQGDLGSGKTTLTRALLHALGYPGHVRSPTYTLVESYPLDPFVLYHFDLYRLGDPEELEYLGIRDYLRPGTVAIIEWPERGRGVLPPADVTVQLSHAEVGRHLRLVGSETLVTGVMAELSERSPG
jgi:tRNA threonylcarbamoyladenosine biosynthesis protein TsaE